MEWNCICRLCLKMKCECNLLISSVVIFAHLKSLWCIQKGYCICTRASAILPSSYAQLSCDVYVHRIYMKLTWQLTSRVHFTFLYLLGALLECIEHWQLARVKDANQGVMLCLVEEGHVLIRPIVLKFIKIWQLFAWKTIILNSVSTSMSCFLIKILNGFGQFWGCDLWIWMLNFSVVPFSKWLWYIRMNGVASSSVHC